MTNWVTRRIACDLLFVLTAIKDRIRADASLMSTADATKRLGLEFEFSEDSGRVRVKRTKGGLEDGGVIMALGDDTITISGTSLSPPLSVFPRWNEKKSRCEILVNGEDLSVEQISEKALAQLFFG